MILQSEILKIAESNGVPPSTIDKDWVLGHFLGELFSQNWAKENLVFKGGTCLKKCYFNDYRFSEDLDFTSVNPDYPITNKILQDVCNSITQNIGILFSKVNVDPKLWKDKVVGYETHIRFWGANHRKNHQPPPSNRWLTEIKIEVVSYETVVNKSVIRKIFHDYSDKNIIAQVDIPCYSLIEIVAEKFRALLQRSYPAPRDYYDLWVLTKNLDESEHKEIAEIFRKKCIFKEVNFNSSKDFFTHSELVKVQKPWNNSLSGHLAESQLPPFEKILIELENVCKLINWK